MEVGVTQGPILEPFTFTVKLIFQFLTVSVSHCTKLNSGVFLLLRVNISI